MVPRRRAASRCFPSRGVRWGSGLEPPPHLVGERARALEVLARGGLVCASAAAVAEGLPPRADAAGAAAVARRRRAGHRRRSPSTSRRPGYERVERVEERGQFAVRGGLVDVFPTTGREPLRIELFGDEIEQIRAFSPFTQRALRQVDDGDDLSRPPSGGASSSSSTLLDDEARTRRRSTCRTTSCRRSTARPTSSGRPTRCARSGRRRASRRSTLDGATELDAAAAGPAVLVRRAAPGARGARALRGRERARTGCCARSSTSSSRSRTAARRCASRQLLRRVDGAHARAGRRRRRASRSPSRPRGAASSGATSASRCCPTRRSSASGRRARPRAPGRALAELLRPAHRRLRRARGPRHRAAARLRDEGGRRRHARLPAARLPRRRPRLRPARADRQGQPLHRRRLEGADALEARRQGLGQPEDARARAPARDGGRAAAALRAAADAARASPTTSSTSGSSGSRRSSRTARPRTSARAIEAVKEDLEAPHPMDRLVCGDVGFGKTEVALRAAFAVAVNGKQVLMLVPTTVLAQQHWNTFRERYRDFPVRVEMVSRFRKPADVEEGARRVRRGQGRRPDRHAPRALARRDPEGARPRDRRRGAALRRRAEGAAAPAAARGRRARAVSATPIPRTLHMSLAGLRDISVIETPPEGRRPIRTYVGEYDEELIKQALEREVERDGPGVLPAQPRRDDRGGGREAARSSARSCASSSRTGRCRERELEDQMLQFLAGDADVLVSTTIIESGLDIPQANTLIVERADQLGLAPALPDPRARRPQRRARARLPLLSRTRAS